MSRKESEAFEAFICALEGVEPPSIDVGPGRPKESYDFFLVLLVEVLMRRDSLSVRGAIKKISPLTVGKFLLFPESEESLRTRYRRERERLGPVVEFCNDNWSAEQLKWIVWRRLLKVIPPDIEKLFPRTR